MIRFIDLGDQILEGQRQFAWWDTVTDTFLQFSGNQTWQNWDDFRVDYLFSFPKGEQIVSGETYEPNEILRFKRLFLKEWP